MDTLERRYWLGFSAFPGIGPMRFKLLLDYFESAEKAWNASKNDLLSTGLGEKLVEKFDDFRREFSLTGYEQKVKDLHIGLLTLQDEKYPRLLREIPDAPFIIYIRGRKKMENAMPAGRQGEWKMESGKLKDKGWNIEKSVGVVGTRRITTYGREATKKIVEGLVDAGVTIVSGLAFGVDAVAHETAMDAGGKTIAVLGCGVDCCNPRSNQYLYDRIVDGNGMILSEFPLSHKTAKGLFPARNRIISGLSLGIVVTEGTEDSGALITASYAAEQGREVFAVPGPVTSAFSKAPNNLLKKGAKLAESADDILEELSLAKGMRIGNDKSIIGSNDSEQAIIDILQKEEQEGDDLTRMLGWEIGKVSSTLSMLEIKGIVCNEGGKYRLA